jgi:hypothetical protein
MNNSLSRSGQIKNSLNEQEEIMEKSRSRIPPRWMFLLLSIGGAWASGIYLGKITIEGASTSLLIPTISFGVMGLIMAWGALTER